MTRFEFVIVGGGIAGLAVAELLQRSGASAALIEQESVLCAGASSEQQGWFHTGALYTALPTNYYCRTLVGNLDDLVDYYSQFPNMNLRVGKHVSTAQTKGWFANKTNFYAYEDWREVSWWLKAPWLFALSRAKSRMSWFENLDSRRSLSRQMSIREKSTNYVKHPVELNLNFGRTAFTLKSRDRAMDTRLIASDLMRSFIASGGTLRLSSTVKRITKGNVIIDSGNGGEQSINARHIIVTTGKAVRAFGVRTNVVVSPLLVTLPAATDVNFVRMCPAFERTINHIVHSIDGQSYSVIGNAVYYPVGSDHELEPARERLVSLAKRVFGGLDRHRMATYFGSKTEIVAFSQLRNYLYHIVETDTHTVALPGKFTLCFSLAVNVCRRFGIDPVENLKLGEASGVDSLVAEPRHRVLASQLLAQSQDAQVAQGG